MPKLVYFAFSVLWRNAVHVWRFNNEAFSIDVGSKYLELLRQYLLGSRDLPEETAIWVAVSPVDAPHIMATFTPRLYKKDPCYEWQMAIPGIVFNLFLGSRIPTTTRSLCTFRSPQQLIYLTPMALDAMLSGMGRLVASTKPSERLRKELESTGAK